MRTAFRLSLSKIVLKECSKEAPVRSSLLIRQTRGTLASSAYRQLVSDGGSTPATPSNTTTAPSRTRKERLTSIVKSICPGVSIILSLYLSGTVEGGRAP